PTVRVVALVVLRERLAADRQPWWVDLPAVLEHLLFAELAGAAVEEEQLEGVVRSVGSRHIELAVATKRFPSLIGQVLLVVAIHERHDDLAGGGDPVIAEARPDPACELHHLILCPLRLAAG